MSDNYSVLFICSVILTYGICVPGMYLILKTRLASSILEVVSTGFFLGFGVVVLAYLGLSRWFNLAVIDFALISAIVLSVIFSVRDLRKHPLPLWIVPPDRVQLILVAGAIIFMGLLAFGDLSVLIDDDLFVHLPNIKRIAMGDIPPHVPYLSETLLRGHCARDLFTGLIARFLQLRPELAIIYVTMSICPVYVLVFHALARRLATDNPMRTYFCFFGLLFMVSAAVGADHLTNGPITYIWNNNAFAYSYAVFFGWLIERMVSTFPIDTAERIGLKLRKNILSITVCAIAYAALYFVYISNFLMFSLYLALLPVFFVIVCRQRRIRCFAESMLVLGSVVAGSAVVQLLVSPLLMERIAIACSIIHPTEPMSIIQQAQLTFPKQHLFSITDSAGNDTPFLTWSEISRQGPSFFLGILGLFVGSFSKHRAIAATSLLGWITMLWLMLVDMGQYRAETLRLLLIGHMAFGGSAGLLVGLFVERLLGLMSAWSERNAPFRPQRLLGAKLLARGFSAVVVLAAACACFYMAWGSVQKFTTGKYWEIPVYSRLMKKIHVKNPDDWHTFLSMRPIDFEAFQIAGESIKGPSERLLLKMAPDEKFGRRSLYKITHLINAGAVTGAGIAGVCQEYGRPHMNVDLFPYDFRASLFWQQPTAYLLKELSPDVIIVDPSLLPSRVLNAVVALPGIAQVCKVEDGEKRHRIILRYSKVDRQPFPPTSIERIEPLLPKAQTDRFGLVRLPVTIIKSNRLGAMITGMVVTDSDGQPVNTIDMPIIEALNLKGERYELCFSMIQKGSWIVNFVDPSSGRRLNEVPVQVTVGDSSAICEFAPRPNSTSISTLATVKQPDSSKIP